MKGFSSIKDFSFVKGFLFVEVFDEMLEFLIALVVVALYASIVDEDASIRLGQANRLGLSFVKGFDRQANKQASKLLRTI